MSYIPMPLNQIYIIFIIGSNYLVNLLDLTLITVDLGWATAVVDSMIPIMGNVRLNKQ